MSKEVWRPVVGYEGLYEVSNKGQVRKRGGNTLKQISRSGYLCVNLANGTTVKDCKVHRLVAQAFLPNPHHYPQVNHKDENRNNNSVDNLEWMSSKDNANYGTRNKRIARTLSRTDSISHSYTEDDILEIGMRWAFYNEL